MKTLKLHENGEIYNEYPVKTRDKCQNFEEIRCVEY